MTFNNNSDTERVGLIYREAKGTGRVLESKRCKRRAAEDTAEPLDAATHLKRAAGEKFIQITNRASRPRSLSSTV